MKKIYFAAMAAIMLASCSDKDDIASQQPLKPGSEVSFSLRLSDSNLSTRTIYGDEKGEIGTKAFPIFWVNNDQVALAAPGAAVQTAVYNIAVDKEGQNYATSMTKIGDAGIQWGTELPQNFYSVYPYKYIDMNDTIIENKFTVEDKKAIANLHIRKIQRQAFTKEEGSKIWKGTPIGNAGMKYPDAIMYAQRQMTEMGEVALKYIPFTTAFNITLDGLDYVGEPEDPIVIQEVIIKAPEGVKLAGDFKAEFNEDATSTPVVNEINITNSCDSIRIPCFDGETENYLHPEKDDQISFNVFAIPVENCNVTADWTLRVKTSNGSFIRKLTPGTGENAGKLIPGQVHKLQMPKIHLTEGVMALDVATWMSQIPRNVYITDLSLPGAWYSRQTQYQGYNDNGKEWTIGELWAKGVRAFSVETRSTQDLLYRNDGVGVSGTGTNRPLTGAYINATRIRGVMSSICAEVRKKNYGYAVLMLSYADGGEGGHRTDDYAYWLEGIYHEYNQLSDEDKKTIYGSQPGEEITSETTIGDVAGRLIIQVNVVDGVKAGEGTITKGNYGNNLPALLTFVNRNREVGTAPISEMHWKTWENEFKVNVIDKLESHDDETIVWNTLNEKLKNGKFYCNYSIANRTATSGTALPTYETRYQALGRILRNSSINLRQKKHNLWSIFAAGGAEATSSTANTGYNESLTFATKMNKWIIDLLNTRISERNYGPFGLVFCNHIGHQTSNTGDYVYGDDIVKRVIRMNQLFRLSRNEDKPEWPDGTQTTKKPANYSSSHSKEQNGWNAF